MAYSYNKISPESPEDEKVIHQNNLGTITKNYVRTSNSRKPELKSPEG